MGAVTSPLRLGLSIAFGLLSFVSLIALIKLPSVLDEIVTARSVLLQRTLAAKLFKTIPFEVRQNVYMFNITNRAEFLAGAKPRFQQLGPYVFKLSLEKFITWDGNTSLTFREKRLFKFAPELSKGFLNDSVITVDPVYASAQKIFEALKEWERKPLAPLLDLRSVLFERSVGELLYDGYTDPLVEMALFFKPDLPVIGGKIGYLRALNNTDDGDITAWTGHGMSDKRNVIFQWKHSSHIPYYGEECNSVWGTNGEVFPTFDSRKPPGHVELFQPTFCRPWKLFFNESLYENGLDLVKYRGGTAMFSATGDYAYDKCFQPNGWKPGVFNVSSCQNGFPALLSLPHFLGAEECLKEVEGLSPDENKHSFDVVIYPRLGVPVRPELRAQINVEITRRFRDDPAKKFNNTPIVYPVLWQELILDESDVEYMSSMIWWTIKLPRLGLCSLALLLCLVGFFLSGSCGKAAFNSEGHCDEEQPVLQEDNDGEQSD